MCPDEAGRWLGHYLKWVSENAAVVNNAFEEEIIEFNEDEAEILGFLGGGETN